MWQKENRELLSSTFVCLALLQKEIYYTTLAKGSLSRLLLLYLKGGRALQKLVIAEKPGMDQSIAAVSGDNQEHNGCLARTKVLISFQERRSHPLCQKK